MAVRKKVLSSKKRPAAVKSSSVKVKKTASKAVSKKSSSTKQSIAKKKTPIVLRGMKDILPKDGSLWQALYQHAHDVARAYNFAYTETPLLEDASLFIRSIGKGTDVVDKEMYVFDDKDGEKISLRPEFTASAVRAYIGHGLHTQPQPVKMWTVGPMFRHDRPQAGRYRQFHQFGCETFGIRDAAIDAELIVMAYNFLRDLGLDIQIHVNSIGNLEDRQRYILELSGYLRTKRNMLSEESKKRLTKNPLRILDSKDEQDIAVLEEAPQILDWLSDDSKKFFMTVLEYLDECKVPYILQPTLVRGLDYYTDTVFELFSLHDTEGSQSALGGGGRYDLLVQELGGPATPASGFALGLERVILALRKKAESGDISLPSVSQPRIYFAQLGDQARRRALSLIEQLRRDDIFVIHNLGKTSLKSQLELAAKHGATHTVILGQKEIQDGTVIIRDMDSGNQEIIDEKKLGKMIQKILNQATK